MSKDIKTQEEHYKYMMETPVSRLVMSFSLPSMVATLITSIYNLTDTWFVGQISTSATAAVGVVFSINMVLLALGFWAGTGGSTLISALIGARDYDKAHRITSSAFWLSFAFGLLVAILSLICGDGLLKLLGATDTILPYARAYLLCLAIAFPFNSSTMMLGQCLRAEGLSRESMIGNIIGAVVNVILDPILIFACNLGVAGAAIATSVSQILGWLFLASCYFTGKTQMSLHPKYLSHDPSEYKEILTAGFPSLCRHGTNTIANIVLNQAAGGFGDAAIAAMSICARLLYASNAVSGGLCNGCQPVIGYAYGAKKYDRVKEAFVYTVKISVGSMVVFGVIGLIFAGPLISFFRDDPDVIVFGTTAYRLIAATLPCACYVNICSVLYQAIKKPLLSSVINLARQLALYIPMLLFLPGLIGALGVQLAGPIADTIVAVVCIPLCISSFKKM